MIPNGVQAIEFRSRVVDTNIAMAKGSIYVGTNMTSNIGGNTVYAVETVDPTNTVSGLQPNSIAIPVYTGSGNTGIQFAAAANISVGRAETMGNSSSPCAVGSASTPVYFSGGKPVACTNSAISVGYASNAGTATTATKLSTSNGNATTPVYFSGGKPIACTNYANATVGAAKSLTSLQFFEGDGTSVQMSCNVAEHGLYVVIATITYQTAPYNFIGLITYNMVGSSYTLLHLSYNLDPTQYITINCSTMGKITVTSSFGGLTDCICYKLATLS